MLCGDAGSDTRCCVRLIVNMFLRIRRFIVSIQPICVLQFGNSGGPLINLVSDISKHHIPKKSYRVNYRSILGLSQHIYV
jgi:hypothetical protein